MLLFYCFSYLVFSCKDKGSLIYYLSLETVPSSESSISLEFFSDERDFYFLSFDSKGHWIEAFFGW